MKKYLLLFSFLSFAFGSVAQKASTATLIKNNKYLAAKTFKTKNYLKSLKYHLTLDSLIPGVPEVKYNIGICYLNSNYKKKALPYFKFCKESNYPKPELDFVLGEAYHYNGQFDKAKKIFEGYIQPLLKDTALYSNVIKEAKRAIEICDFAKELVADSIPVEIESIGGGINTVDDEYVPIVTADQQTMYFTSRRKNEHNQRISYDGRFYEDIYISEKDSTGKWKKAKDAPHPVNGPEHDACIGISADGQNMYIFRVKSTTQNKGDIYSTKLEGKAWAKPAKLGSQINARKGAESSISLSKDRKRLYFSSDREGGFGGLDIWFSDLLPNKEWGEPKNAGNIINTEYDEDCPYIHLDDQTLFFSSTGHKTMGGYDVFTSVLDLTDKVTFTEPTNIGYPINTADDDMYFVYSADGSKGYMSSAVRDNCMGERDIYVVNRPHHSKSMIVLNGKVTDDETQKAIEATITVTDLAKNEVIGVYSTNSVTGKYAFPLDFGKNYSVQFEANNYIFHSENVNVSNPQAIFRENISFKLQKIKAGNSLVLNNVFFDVNQHTLQEQSLPELDKLQDFLMKHPHIYIQITGFTDSVGQDAYNLKLSKKRAQSVLDYLVARGIPNKNIRIMGYGEAKPVATNGTEEGRKLNRRTECLIYDMDAMPKEQLEYFSKLDTTNDAGLILEDIMAESKVGNKLNPQVHFLYNNGEFMTEFSKTQLAKVAAALKRVPKMTLELQGSTDVVGNEYNNKVLYETRQHTVLQYFTENGIAPERFKLSPFKASDAPKATDMNQGNGENRKVQFILTAF